jgi:hypothetical protein
MNWQVRMKKIDARALKAQHRLELVMQELGERFEVSGDQWHSITTRGLVVDLDQQIYEYQKPGMGKEAGDLYDWLKRRYGWSFRQVIQYLQKRESDLDLEVQPIKVESEIKPLIRQEWKYEVEHRDNEKDESGLYDVGLVDTGEKTFFQYLLKPSDHWQERALEIGGEEMREYFTWKSWEIEIVRRGEPSRFVPVQDMDVGRCDECEQPIEWWWKQKPEYVHQEIFTPGFTGTTWNKVRVIQEPQVYAFEYEQYEETFCICENCKRKKINYREALNLLYKSARKHEALEQKK